MNRIISQYKILSGGSTAILEEEVNRLAQEGWSVSKLSSAGFAEEGVEVTIIMVKTLGMVQDPKAPTPGHPQSCDCATCNRL